MQNSVNFVSFLDYYMFIYMHTCIYILIFILISKVRRQCSLGHWAEGGRKTDQGCDLEGKQVHVSEEKNLRRIGVCSTIHNREVLARFWQEVFKTYPSFVNYGTQVVSITVVRIMQYTMHNMRNYLLTR